MRERRTPIRERSITKPALIRLARGHELGRAGQERGGEEVEEGGHC